MNSKDLLTINTIRVLSAEAIQRAKSGHPGIVMGSAPMAYQLWAKQLKHNPANPNWLDRDRFVLSAGHGSMLLYSMLHLFGYGLEIEDLRQFRQFGSKTPGHPEFRSTVGVEMTTGPLGQGIANAVGMALAESHLAAKFNRDDCKIVDHYTYALCGDGCMMEGISAEAASIAGTLGLGKLIVLYDSNNITIEGNTEITFRENVLDRFAAQEWHVQRVEDGNNIDDIGKAIDEAKKVLDKPSLIEVKTVIGFGSPNKCGKSSSHGEPLGIDELKATKENLGWDLESEFFVPEQVKENMEEIKARLAKEEKQWNQKFEMYCQKYPELAKEWQLWHEDNFIEKLYDDESFWNCDKDMATRQSSEIILNKIADIMPNLFGGSADLAPSNKSIMKNKGDYTKQTPEGSNIHFGIREHAMTAMANGMAVHGGVRPYIAGFFVFCDYMKPAMRLSALMKLPVISILTHDSIGVGEDGPTHQPIEQLASLRSIPNCTVIRPCDTNETAAAWYAAITRKDSPTALIFTRQMTKAIKGTGKKALKGAYILKDAENNNPDIILIASGSEVYLISQAYDILKEKGINARVVSMPSFELFEEQTEEYKNSVLPKNIRKRLAVEAASSFGWYKYIGLDGDIICMDIFGSSAPFVKLFQEYGFTIENVVNRAIKLLEKE